MESSNPYQNTDISSNLDTIWPSAISLTLYIPFTIWALRMVPPERQLSAAIGLAGYFFLIIAPILVRRFAPEERPAILRIPALVGIGFAVLLVSLIVQRVEASRHVCGGCGKKGVYTKLCTECGVKSPAVNASEASTLDEGKRRGM